MWVTVFAPSELQIVRHRVQTVRRRRWVAVKVKRRVEEEIRGETLRLSVASP